MADDPVFEAGTARLPIGTKISADDVGGALYQRVKLVWGANGTVHEADTLTADAIPVQVINTLPAPTIGEVTLTGSYVDHVANALRVSVTSIAAHLVSVTGTVSVQITSQPEQTLTGSYVDGASNALRGSLTAASRLFSLTGTVSVVVLSMPAVSLTGSFVNAALNALDVNIVGGAGSGGTAQADKSAFTYGTTSVTPIGATTAAGSISGSVVGAVRMTEARGLHTVIVDSAGVAAGVSNVSGAAGASRRLSTWPAYFSVLNPVSSLSAGNTTADLTSSNPIYALTSVQLTGTWAGDIFFEATTNGVDFVAVDALPSTGNTYVSQVTGNGVWIINASGYQGVRARFSVSSGVAIVDSTNNAGGNVRQAAGSSSGGAVSLTGSFVDGVTNALRVTLTSVPAHLVSITGTVSVQITSQPEQTLTGSYVDGASNALRGSLTAASRLFSLTGTASVQITSAVSLSVQITSTIVPFSLTGSFINLANNAIRVEGTLTFLAETRYATPATSKLTRANIDFSTSASSTIVAGVGGQTIRIMKIMFTSAAATTFNFESSTSALSGLMTLPANGALVLDLDGEPWYVTSTADPFRLHINAASQIGGTVWYTQS